MDVSPQYSAALMHAGKTCKRKTASSYVTVTKRVNKLHIETTQLGLACRVFSSPPT